MIHFNSVVYLMTIISRPINPSNDSDPGDAGKATSINEDGWNLNKNTGGYNKDVINAAH